MMVAFSVFWNDVRIIINKGFPKLRRVVIFTPFICHPAKPMEKDGIKPSCCFGEP